MSAGVSPQSGALQPIVVPDTPSVGPTSASKAPDSSIPAVSLSQQLDRSKYTSPAPGASSNITPPPSTQVPSSQKHVLRTPSPPTSQLTSPPPTNRPPIHHTSQNVKVNDLPTTEQVNLASVDDLRLMVHHLNLSVREARTKAAHFQLQHNMLILDSEKASERMTVELEMSQREVEALQTAEKRRRNEFTGPAQMSASAVMISDLNRHCQLLQSENDEFRDVLTRAERDLEDRDGQVLALREENQRLRHRIRQNREHMNGLLDSVSDGSPRSLMATPHRTPHHNTTPRHLPSARAPMMQSLQGREPGAFEALLLADRVLNSQETATAPSTPKSQPLKHRLGHTRNTHSLSSLPTTPSRRPLHPPASAFRTPPQLTAIMEPPSVGQPLLPHLSATTGATRRRASSDSTITASSIDEREQMSGSDDDEIPESQASQVATSMLRRTPSSSQQKGRMTQSKIVGKVTKAVSGRIMDVEKRRLTSYGAEQGQQHGSPTKKSRVEGSGAVGLGIGMPGRGE